MTTDMGMSETMAEVRLIVHEALWGNRREVAERLTAMTAGDRQMLVETCRIILAEAWHIDHEAGS